MLVLRRKEQEVISIMDGLITVRVVQICGRTVKLGITAPPHISVHRMEIQQEIDEEANKLG